MGEMSEDGKSVFEKIRNIPTQYAALPDGRFGVDSIIVEW